VLKKAGVRKAGLLATDGTIQSGIYAEALEAEGIEPVLPTAEHQREIMRLIYDGVKARKLPLAEIPVQEILEELRSRGAEQFLLACTELPIAFAELGITADCLDPTRVLAFSAVGYAGAAVTCADPW